MLFSNFSKIIGAGLAFGALMFTGMLISSPGRAANDNNGSQHANRNTGDETLAGNALQHSPRNQTAEQARRKNSELQVMDECTSRRHRRKNGDDKQRGGQHCTTAMPSSKPRE